MSDWFFNTTNPCRCKASASHWLCPASKGCDRSKPSTLSVCVYCGSRHGERPAYAEAARAVGTAIGLMKLTRTVHPPACSNPLIIFALKPSWTFLLFPTLAGAALIIIFALFYHNLRREARWPKYWL